MARFVHGVVRAPAGSQVPILIHSIRVAEPAATVVVVDDGSGPAYKAVFDDVRNRGCHVLGHAGNRGKGSR